MKKGLIALVLLILFTITACSRNDDEVQLKNAVDSFTIFEDGREVESDFSLPLNHKTENGKDISINWEVVKGDLAAEIVENNLVKVYYLDLEIDVQVQLEASFTLKSFTLVKIFTFNVPKYESEDIELKDAYVVYINIDGFARYYYDEAVRLGVVSNLENFKNDGIFYDNLRTLTPSITNSVQNMIISGASSSKTENIYRYYDKTNDIVIQQARENAADTIYQSGVRANIKMATVRHFLAEGTLTQTNVNRLYVQVEDGVEANQVARMKQAIKLVKGEEFKNGSYVQKVSEVPRLLTIYLDEVDALGHNESPTYGVPIADNEEDRVKNVVDALEVFDGLILELVDAYKARGIYDKTAFFITTDHGMTPFGAETRSGAFTNKYNKTRWPELSDKLKEINSEFDFEYVAPGSKPNSNTTVVGVGAGLQMPLTFKHHRLTNEELDEIALELEKEYYVEKVITRKELVELGVWRGANFDLLVIPSERYHFHNRSNNLFSTYAVRGQHDSMLDSSNHIYGIIFGGLIKENVIIKDEVRVISFGRMMAETLGLNLRDANAELLDIYKES